MEPDPIMVNGVAMARKNFPTFESIKDKNPIYEKMMEAANVLVPLLRQYLIGKVHDTRLVNEINSNIRLELVNL